MHAGALRGTRIVDFGWAWAGPIGAMLLAFLGAEVIKVESRTRLDITRLDKARDPSMRQEPGAMPDPETLPQEWLESSSRWHDANMSKLAVRLNLRTPEGKALARRLVAVSDGVIENFTPGVLDRLGLGYAALREARPDLVMASVSTAGARGPWGRYVGYGTVFAALSGLSHLTGYPDSRPAHVMESSDLRTGTTCALAMVAALLHRVRTGKGQYIDVSAVESLAAGTGEVLLDYIMNAREQARQGNRDPAMAPHNAYRCQGEDRWVSIAVGSDREWHALADAIGRPDLKEDPRFRDGLSRWHHQEALDQTITEWTRRRSPREVMEVLQQRGVAAMPTFDARDLAEDPHMRASGALVEVDHPYLGRRYVVGAPFAFSGTPARVERAPLMGEHNQYILGELLGLPTAEVERLAAEKVVY